MSCAVSAAPPDAKSERRRADQQVLPIEPIAVRPGVAARLLGISERKIWRLIDEGRLRISREGNTTFVHTASLRQLLTETQV